MASFKANLINLGRSIKSAGAGATASISLFGGAGTIKTTIGGTRDTMTLSAGEIVLQGYNSNIALGNIVNVGASDLVLSAGGRNVSLAKLNSGFVSKTYSNVSLASGSYRYETVTTVSQSGIYLICCSSVTQSTSTKGTAKVGVRINGSASHTLGACPIRGDYPELHGVKILSLSAGDSVQYWNYQNGGYGETISSRAIQMIMLCPT